MSAGDKAFGNPVRDWLGCGMKLEKWADAEVDLRILCLLRMWAILAMKVRPY